MIFSIDILTKGRIPHSTEPLIQRREGDFQVELERFLELNLPHLHPAGSPPSQRDLLIESRIRTWDERIRSNLPIPEVEGYSVSPAVRSEFFRIAPHIHPALGRESLFSRLNGYFQARAFGALGIDSDLDSASTELRNNQDTREAALLHCINQLHAFSEGKELEVMHGRDLKKEMTIVLNQVRTILGAGEVHPTVLRATVRTLSETCSLLYQMQIEEGD